VYPLKGQFAALFSIGPNQAFFLHLSLGHVTIFLVTCLRISWTYTLQPWRWRQHVPPKLRYPPTKLHSINPEDYILNKSDIDVGPFPHLWTKWSHPNVLWGSPSLQSNGYYRLFLRKKKDNRSVAIHLHFLQIKTVWSYTATPPYVVMAWCLTQRQLALTW
jgi:hypothetical protein